MRWFEPGWRSRLCPLVRYQHNERPTGALRLHRTKNRGARDLIFCFINTFLFGKRRNVPCSSSSSCCSRRGGGCGSCHYAIWLHKKRSRLSDCGILLEQGGKEHAELILCGGKPLLARISMSWVNRLCLRWNSTAMNMKISSGTGSGSIPKRCELLFFLQRRSGGESVPAPKPQFYGWQEGATGSILMVDTEVAPDTPPPGSKLFLYFFKLRINCRDSYFLYCFLPHTHPPSLSSSLVKIRDWLRARGTQTLTLYSALCRERDNYHWGSLALRSEGCFETFFCLDSPLAESVCL